MKVKNLISLVKMTLEIFEVYEDKTVSFMLTDIKNKVTGKDASVLKQKEEPKRFDVNESITILRSINRDQVKEYLKQMDKANIEEIVIKSNLNIDSKETKQKLIEKLANHYNLLNVNDQMSRRYSDSSTASTMEVNKSQGFFSE